MIIEKYLVALTIVGIVDSISYMVVTPSLVFYVFENGGTQNQYGMIMSIFSFSSFCFKPIIGYWSDRKGFRIPYFVSICLALMGGILYVSASALSSGAVACIFVARLLGGCGGANSALGFAYNARTVPPEKQTSVNSLLSLCRIFGMALGPVVNILVANIDIPIGTKGWKLDKLNSVGGILIIANFISILAIYLLLEEPSTEEKNKKNNNNNSNDDNDNNGDDNNNNNNKTITDPETNVKLSSVSSTRSVTNSRWEALLSFVLSPSIMIPMLSIFTFNANFQLVETGFAPAAYDGLGWGPVQSSAALGSISIIIAMNMFAVIQLSTRYKVSDAALLCTGLCLSIVAYTIVYFAWIKDSSVWNFYLPILFGACAFPYMSATTRSIFTVAVQAKPLLAHNQGSMQAILSMAASVAGFTTPSFVAAYCLRPPDEVSASIDHRELTPYALFGPILSFVVLLGMFYLHCTGTLTKLTTPPSPHPANNKDVDVESLMTTTTTNESSSLLPLKKNNNILEDYANNTRL